MTHNFFYYLAVSAGVTYLIRMVPLVLFKREIKNKFLLSFLHYVPYTVLAVMTIPAVFYATSTPLSAAIGVAVALVAAFYEKSLLFVASVSCSAVLVCELFIKYLM